MYFYTLIFYLHIYIYNIYSLCTLDTAPIATKTHTSRMKIAAIEAQKDIRQAAEVLAYLETHDVCEPAIAAGWTRALIACGTTCRHRHLLRQPGTHRDAQQILRDAPRHRTACESSDVGYRRYIEMPSLPTESTAPSTTSRSTPLTTSIQSISPATDTSTTLPTSTFKMLPLGHSV